jgi:geranylgeranyl diphosphate synthase type I
MQEIITQTGALAHIELMIEELTNSSLSALNFDEINPVGKDLLTQLAVIATSRKI